MNEDYILVTYESIARLTRQMLAAARDGDWDTLVQRERDCSGLFAQLFSGEDDRPRSAEFQRRKAELICTVLDDDAEIRLLVEPWLTQLSALIGHTSHQRQLVRAYRTVD